jgi:hypothetical protein
MDEPLIGQIRGYQLPAEVFAFPIGRETRVMSRNDFSFDRLCCLVVRVPGYRSKNLGSILVATRFSEK